MYQNYCPCYLHLYMACFLTNCLQNARNAASDNPFFQNVLVEDTPDHLTGSRRRRSYAPTQQKFWLRACKKERLNNNLVLGLCWWRVRCKQASVSNPGLIYNSRIPPPTNRKSWNEIARLQLCQITSPLQTAISLVLIEPQI